LLDSLLQEIFILKEQKDNLTRSLFCVTQVNMSLVPEKVFICPVCSVVYRNKKYFNKHKAKHPKYKALRDVIADAALPALVDALAEVHEAYSGSKKAVVDRQGNTSQSLVNEDGYCVICQDAHKTISSCLQDVMCKNCSLKGHLRIDCPRDSVALEETKKTRCGIKRKAQVVEGNISSKVCHEVLSKSSCHPNVKFELESNEIIAPDDIKVENQKPVSMKQEYYEDDIIMKKEGEYFKETNPSPVKSEHIVDNPSSSVIDSVSCLWTMSHLQKDEGKT